MTSTNDRGEGTRRRHARLTEEEKAARRAARRAANAAAQAEADHAAAERAAAAIPPLTDEQKAELRPLLDLTDLDGEL